MHPSLINRRSIITLFCVCLVVAPRGEAAETAPLRPELAPQVGQSNWVSAGALSPDGTLAASSGADGLVNIWNARTGEVIHTLTPPLADAVGDLQFSPDGALLAVATEGFRRDSKSLAGVSIWQPRTGVMLYALSPLVDGISKLAFSPDGRWLAGAGSRRPYPVQLWDLKTATLSHTLKSDGFWIDDMAFTPGGKTLRSVSGQSKNTLEWDIQTGQLLRTINLDPQNKYASEIRNVVAALSADGAHVAFARQNVDGAAPFPVQVCDVATGRVLRALTDGRNYINTIAFAPNGKTLVVAFYNQTENNVELWNPLTGQLLQRLTHQSEASASNASPNGANANAAKNPLPDVVSFAFSADGTSLLSGDLSGHLKLWDASQPAKIALNRSLSGREDMLMALSFSADSTSLSSRSISVYQRQSQLRDWDVRSGALMSSQTQDEYVYSSDVISPDGALRLHRPRGGDLQIVNAATDAVLHTLPDTGTFKTRNAVFLKDSKTLVGGSGNQLSLWDAVTGQLKKSIPAHQNPIRAVAVTEDGSLLASVEVGGNIKIWDTTRLELGTPLRTMEQKEPIKLLDGGDNPFSWRTLTFAPDNSTLAVTAFGKTALFNARTGELIRELAGHSGYVFSAAFAPDGKRIATGGNGTINLWNAQSGRLLATFHAFPPAEVKPVFARDEFLTITPEGYYFSSAAGDRYMRFRMGEALFPAEAFHAPYYRPDLVARSLAGEELPPPPLLQGAYPPLATFVLPQAKSEFVPETLPLTVMTTDDGEVKDIVMFVNGARVDAKAVSTGSRPLSMGSRALIMGSKALSMGSKALSMGAKPLTADSRTVTAEIPSAHKVQNSFTVSLPLPPGESHLKVQVIAVDNDGLQSPREELLVTRESIAVKPGKLLGLCIGVSRYQHAELNLKYSAVDATSLTREFNRQGTIYSASNLVSLTDAQATSPAVTRALDALIAQATRADTVVVALSGHGWKDEQNSFYFATHEVNPKDVASTALPWKSVIERLTLLSEKSKRVIMLLDACHSGSAATNEQLLKATLSGNAGVLVFASSRGSEVSLESDEWAHGAFTKAALEAIVGQAVPPEETRITTLDFLSYVARRVKTLTANQQHPQVPFLQDFDTDAPIAVRP